MKAIGIFLLCVIAAWLVWRFWLRAIVIRQMRP